MTPKGDDRDRINMMYDNANVSPGKKAALRAAASAAAIVAVCGAFYIGTLFSKAPTASAPKPVATATAETTGSAPPDPRESSQDVASTDAAAPSGAANCQEQTWPYIARPCLANEKAPSGKSQRGVRVISTDNVAEPVINRVEAPPETVTNRKVAPPAQPVVAAAPASSGAPASNSTPLKSGASLGAVAVSPAARTETAKAEPVEATTAVATEPAKPAAVEPAAASAAPAQQATLLADEEQLARDNKKKASREAALEKAKRKAKRLEAERIRTATAKSDDDEDETAAETRGGKIRGRVVERWTERDYNVPSYEGGTRRVIVTGRDSRSTERSVSTSERSSGTDLFSVIFGGGGDR